MNMNKADKRESKKRVLQISEWLLEGQSTYEIVEHCGQNWGIKRAQVYKYIDKAKGEWEETYKKDFVNNLNWHLIARRRLYKNALKGDRYSEANNILKDIADLQGLYKQVHEITGKDGEMFQHLVVVRHDGKE